MGAQRLSRTRIELNLNQQVQKLLAHKIPEEQLSVHSGASSKWFGHSESCTWLSACLGECLASSEALPTPSLCSGCTSFLSVQTFRISANPFSMKTFLIALTATWMGPLLLNPQCSGLALPAPFSLSKCLHTEVAPVPPLIAAFLGVLDLCLRSPSIQDSSDSYPVKNQLRC